MKKCSVPGCNNMLRYNRTKCIYCSKHLARIYRNGNLEKKKGTHGLEKLPHGEVDEVIRSNRSLTDAEILEILNKMGLINVKKWNIRYRRRRLGVKKYDGKHSKERAKRIAQNAYGKKCEICGYSLIVEVHHIIGKDGGKNRNNDLSNLSILCPCCHSLITRNFIKMNSRSDIPDLKIQLQKLLTDNTFCT